MSIEFLHKLSTLHGPLDLTRPDEVDHVLVLRAAGLVSAFTLRYECPAREIARFLSLTPEGRVALALAMAHASGSSSASSSSHPQPLQGPHP